MQNNEGGISPSVGTLHNTGSSYTAKKYADLNGEVKRVTKSIKFQRQKSFDMESFSNSGSFSNSLQVEKALKKKTRSQLLRQPSSFTREEILSLQAAFCKLDQDGNGYLSHEEVSTALGDMLPQEDMQSLLEEMDADGNGEIKYQVLLKLGALLKH